MQGLRQSRPVRVPDGVEAYRAIGPFDETTLPAGLRQDHSLKQGTWAIISLTEGALTFTWNDERGGSEHLRAPAELTVPPLVPHRVELTGPVALSITFYRKPDGEGRS